MKNCVYKCIKYFRERATTITQIIVELLVECTLNHVSPLTHTRVDYARPIQLKEDKLHKLRSYKGYITRLSKFRNSEDHNNRIMDELNKSLWQFLLHNSPHFGGILETGVKFIKQYLKKVMSNIVAPHYEYSTMCYQIEGLLNSHPLGPINNVYI